jgi:hypothetical protein
MPDDVVTVTNKRHAQLLDGQGLGRAIIADENGNPALDAPARVSRSSLLSAAVYAIKEEARARILAVANHEQQINDLAAIATGTDGADAARDRRAKIDEIRAASGVAEGSLEPMSVTALGTFNAADNGLWPEWSAK